MRPRTADIAIESDQRWSSRSSPTVEHIHHKRVCFVEGAPDMLPEHVKAPRTLLSQTSKPPPYTHFDL